MTISAESQPMPRAMAEKDFALAVVQFAHVLGWKIAQVRAARTAHGWVTPWSADGQGWPDLFLVHPASGDRFAAELKVRYAKPTDEQVQWGEWLTACGIEHHVWWPPDWPEIVARLAHRRAA